MSSSLGFLLGISAIAIGIAFVLSRGGPANAGWARRLLQTRPMRYLIYAAGALTAFSIIGWLIMGVIPHHKPQAATPTSETPTAPAQPDLPPSNFEEGVTWLWSWHHLGIASTWILVIAALIGIAYVVIRFVVTPAAGAAHGLHWNGKALFWTAIAIIALTWYLNPTIVGSKWNTLVAGFGGSETSVVELPYKPAPMSSVPECVQSHCALPLTEARTTARIQVPEGPNGYGICVIDQNKRWVLYENLIRLKVWDHGRYLGYSTDHHVYNEAKVDFADPSISSLTYWFVPISERCSQ
jgi:hypothetical protein